MENYSYNYSVIIEDAAWSLHYHFLVNGKDSSAFDAVLKMAEAYNFGLQDKAELHIIANNVAKREHNERNSIHGRLPKLEVA